MFVIRLRGLALTVIVAVCSIAIPLDAQQQHRGSPNALAADVVFLKSKTTFYGVINDATDDDVTLVVERQWLETSYPQLFSKHQELESKTAQEAETRLIERIDDWIEERSDDVNLKIFLEDEKAAAQKRLANSDFASKRFTFLRFPKSDVRRVVLQPAEQRQIALVAWHQNLPNATTRTAEDLRKTLEQQKVDISATSIDFADDVPGIPQSEHDWAIRKSIVEFVLRESLEFQGTGEAFFRRGKQPGFATLITQIMGQGGIGGIQQIGEELGLPEFTRRPDRLNETKKDWWKTQARIADDEGFRSFSIARLQQNLLSPKVKVEVFFFGKDENDEWRMVRSFQGAANADRQAEADVEALMDDPQVKQVVEMAEGLGLGATANIKKALRHGVATQVAMQNGMNKFVAFTDRFSRRLDAPEIPSKDR